MAYKGKKINHPFNKQTIEFVTTAKESKGRLLEMIATWEPHSIEPVKHYHPYQDELFSLLEGEMNVVLDGKKIRLKKGDTIEIPANTVHSMWNESAQKAVMQWKVTPALQTEYFFENAMGLATDGKMEKADFMQTILLAQKYRKEFRLHKPPYIIQRLIFALLTPIGLLSGKKAAYEKYMD